MKQNIIYQGNSVISVETHPEYSHPAVVIKKPSKRRPSQRSLRSLEKILSLETKTRRSILAVRCDTDSTWRRVLFLLVPRFL